MQVPIHEDSQLHIGGAPRGAGALAAPHLLLLQAREVAPSLGSWRYSEVHQSVLCQFEFIKLLSGVHLRSEVINHIVHLQEEGAGVGAGVGASLLPPGVVGEGGEDGGDGGPGSPEDDMGLLQARGDPPPDPAPAHRVDDVVVVGGGEHASLGDRGQGAGSGGATHKATTEVEGDPLLSGLPEGLSPVEAGVLGGRRHHLGGVLPADDHHRAGGEGRAPRHQGEVEGATQSLKVHLDGGG